MGSWVSSSSSTPDALVPPKPVITHVVFIINDKTINQFIRAVQPEDLETFGAFSAFVTRQPEVQRAGTLDKTVPFSYHSDTLESREKGSNAYVGMSNTEDFALAKRGAACVSHLFCEKDPKSFASSWTYTCPYWTIRINPTLVYDK